MKIYQNWAAMELHGSTGEFYLIDENVKGHYYGGTGNYVFTDLTNALLTGKICMQVSLDYNWHEKGSDCLSINYINNVVKGNIRALFNIENVDIVEKLPYDNGYSVKYTQNDKEFTLSVYTRELKSSQVFSPFCMERLKPLTEIPKKMTTRHAIRAIINGQVKNLKCNGIYTDDYAFDAAYNYRQGEIVDRVSFIQPILSRPSGWHVWESNGVYNLNCHSFDTNEFELCLECDSTRIEGVK